MNSYGIVIIGAGEAGARAALELRNQGWNGPVTLVGKESAAPYERPPLSKSVLTSDIEPSPTFILNQEMLSDHNVQWFQNISVTRIDRQRHIVSLGNDAEIQYERLLLATGASPRKLLLDGMDPCEILYLRSFSDALRIRSELNPGKRIVIIGGGFIGLEVAASARKKGCAVTLIEAGPRILMRGVPVQIAQSVEDRHRSAGVEFKLGVGIIQIERSTDRGQLSIRLSDHSVICCDTIIAGIGAIPNTELAAASGLKIENGIAVDETLATSDPDIFAAGDCCSFPHRLYDGRRIRLEAWRNAHDQGIHAARNMLGGSEAYTAIPWFWSDQYDLTLQVAGLPDAAAVHVERKSVDGNPLFLHLAADHRIVAASGIGLTVAKDLRIAEMMIEKRLKLNLETLSAPDLKLKTLLNA